MTRRVAIVGLDEPEYAPIRKRLPVPAVCHETLPRMAVRGGELLVSSREGLDLLPVGAVVFHGIFEDDLDFIAGLALWGGPCLPRARGMMDCRLKLPCLVRALEATRFPIPGRGYAGPRTPFEAPGEWVAKWGNWHCGENKARFAGRWRSEEASIVEPFLTGRAVRVMALGDRVWQIELEGEDWKKSLHDARARLTEPDADLVADTQAIRRAFGLELVANDYLVTGAGTPHLLEVNHIPNVTRFDEIREAYLDFVVDWVERTLR